MIAFGFAGRSEMSEEGLEGFSEGNTSLRSVRSSCYVMFGQKTNYYWIPYGSTQQRAISSAGSTSHDYLHMALTKTNFATLTPLFFCVGAPKGSDGCFCLPSYEALYKFVLFEAGHMDKNDGDILEFHVNFKENNAECRLNEKVLIGKKKWNKVGDDIIPVVCMSAAQGATVTIQIV